MRYQTKIVLDQLSSFIYKKDAGSNNFKFVDAKSEQTEITENFIKKLLEWTRIDEAKGRVLDWKGQSYGVFRSGRNDQDYRSAIKLGINLRTQNGSHNSIINALSNSFNVPKNFIKLFDHNNEPTLPDRGLRLQIPSELNVDQVRKALIDVKAAGKVIVSITVVPTTDAFVFDGVEPWEAFGYGTLSDVG